MTDKEKKSPEYMAALGAMLGSLVYQEKIKLASVSRNTAEMDTLMEEYGKMILEVAFPERDSDIVH